MFIIFRFSKILQLHYFQIFKNRKTSLFSDFQKSHHFIIFHFQIASKLTIFRFFARCAREQTTFEPFKLCTVPLRTKTTTCEHRENLYVRLYTLTSKVPHTITLHVFTRAILNSCDNLTRYNLRDELCTGSAQLLIGDLDSGIASSRSRLLIWICDFDW